MKNVFYDLNFLGGPSSIKCLSQGDSDHWGWSRYSDFNLIRLVDSLTSLGQSREGPTAVSGEVGLQRDDPWIIESGETHW